MAERTVISEIDFQEGPGRAALVRLEGELARLQAQSGSSASGLRSHWEVAGDAFEHRMFSMREAARALLGGLTVGGLVLGLKSLAQAVIESSDNFKTLEASAGNVQREFFSLARTTFDVNEGLADTTTWLDRIAGGMRALNEVQAQHPAASSAAKQGYLGMIMFGIPGAASIISSLQQIGALTDKAIPKQIQAAKLAGITSFVEPGSRADIIDPFAFAAKAGPALARRAMNDFIDQLHEATEVSEGLFLGWETGWEDAKVSVEDTTEAVRNFTENAIRPMRTAEIAVMAAGDAFQFLAQAMSTAIAEGGKGRDLFRGVLIGLSATMFAKAAEYVAYALAASTGIGAATLGGTPAQFGAAAAKFAAVGTLAGLAARASGGGSTGGAGGVRGVAVTPPSSPSGQSITVIIEGNASEDTVDKIIDAISTRLKDGVAGGNFNGQLMRSKA